MEPKGSFTSVYVCNAIYLARLKIKYFKSRITSTNKRCKDRFYFSWSLLTTLLQKSVTLSNLMG